MSGPAPGGRILAVVGMRAEARLLARVGVEAVVGGGDSARLAAELDRRLSQPETFDAVLSFGVAGGLSPELRAGDLVVATGVLGPGALPADAAWAQRLRAALPWAHAGLIAGREAPVASEAEKARLFGALAAVAVDMESHIGAAAAARHGRPFAAVRAISDPAGATLPAAALAGFGSDGRADIAAVLRALARDPRQLPAVVRTGREAGRAFQVLGRALKVPALLTCPP